MWRASRSQSGRGNRLRHFEATSTTTYEGGTAYADGGAVFLVGMGTRPSLEVGDDCLFETNVGDFGGALEGFAGGIVQWHSRRFFSPLGVWGLRVQL